MCIEAGKSFSYKNERWEIRLIFIDSFLAVNELNFDMKVFPIFRIIKEKEKNLM